jgi:hypothetical protein
MFQPVIPMTGNTGWKFLQSTYDRQLKSYSDSPQIKSDRAYLEEKFSKPVELNDFLKDNRLLRVAMTSFDLGGEEWKRGFISKVLNEAADPESTFLTRLNNAQYTAFAKAFTPVDGKISIDPDALQAIGDAFEKASFETAVGEIDDSMRLALNYQSDISRVVGEGSSETAVLYRILGDVPVRTLLETATGLPSSISQLPLDQQTEMLKSALKKNFGISDIHDLANEGNVEKVIRRYHAMEAVANGASSYSGASAALTLLNGGAGLGGQGGINLLLSSL